tara:strand:- start:1151 stop:2161 length:1011 start_codon:yes stop_codon:yes gene_type:complete
MYKKLIRPLLFLFNPESIHNFSFFFLKFFLKIPLMKPLMKSLFSFNNQKLETSLLGLNFKNRIGLAAGFDKNAEFLNEMECFGFGHVEVGTITPQPQPGNSKPRLFRLKSENALINRMGFNNDGVEKILNRIKSYKGDLVIGANIGKNKITPNSKAIDDYLFSFKKLRDYVSYFVINVSSPNTPNLRELQSKENLNQLVKKIQLENLSKKKKIPILIKIAPDLSKKKIDDIIDVCIKNKIDGIIATNTTISKENINNNEKGGLSGKPLYKQSNNIIKYLKINTKNKIKIIGVGGIFNGNDVYEKLNFGADLVQVYTGWIYEGPSMVNKINKYLLKK